jgi:hypothetical protein
MANAWQNLKCGLLNQRSVNEKPKTKIPCRLAGDYI